MLIHKYCIRQQYIPNYIFNKFPAKFICALAVLAFFAIVTTIRLNILEIMHEIDHCLPNDEQSIFVLEVWNIILNRNYKFQNNNLPGIALIASLCTKNRVKLNEFVVYFKPKMFE